MVVEINGGNPAGRCGGSVQAASDKTRYLLLQMAGFLCGEMLEVDYGFRQAGGASFGRY